MQKFLVLCLGLAATCSVATAASADEDVPPIEILSTRVIYNEGESSATLSVRNSDTSSYLVGVTIEPFQGIHQSTGETTEDFMSSPSIRVIRPGETYPFRIIRLAEDLPQDTESLYIVAVRIVPSQEKLNNESMVQTRLVLSMMGRLKFFYRPSSLAKTFGVEELRQRLRASCLGKTVTLFNPSPYWGTFDSLSFDGRNILSESPKPMIAPEHTAEFSVAVCPRIVSVSFLSENGIATPVREIHVETHSQ